MGPSGVPKKSIFGLKNGISGFPVSGLCRGSGGVATHANGGLDPWWLNLAFLGRPDFHSRGPKTFSVLGDWKSGRPKKAKFNDDAPFSALWAALGQQGVQKWENASPRRMAPSFSGLGSLHTPWVVHMSCSNSCLHCISPIMPFRWFDRQPLHMLSE